MPKLPVDTRPQAPALDLDAVAIDRDADVPIGVQLAWALRTRIGDGRLKPSQRLPGLREMAEATGVNVNTVRAVYQRLEQDGLINSQQGSGTFVAPTPPNASAVGTIAADAARQAQETGVDPRAVAAALYVSRASFAQAADELGERSESAQRRLLRGQIAGLERTLAQIEADYPGIAPLPTQTRRGIGPALLSARELAHVRAGLLRRLARIQTAIDDYTAGRAPASSLPHVAPARRRTTAKPALASARRKAANPGPAVERPTTAAQRDVARTPKRAKAPRSAPRPSPAST